MCVDCLSLQQQVLLLHLKFEHRTWLVNLKHRGAQLGSTSNVVEPGASEASGSVILLHFRVTDLAKARGVTVFNIFARLIRTGTAPFGSPNRRFPGWPE